MAKGPAKSRAANLETPERFEGVRLMPPVLTLPTDDLEPDPRNARTHDDRQLDALAQSIRRFGFNKPIEVVPHPEQPGRWRIGNGEGRWRAAVRLGMLQVPAVDISHLSETQVREYRLADNQVALLAGWNEDMLRLEAAELSDLGAELIGWTAEEAAALIGDAKPLDGMPALPNGEKAPYQQVTFILHDRQVETVKRAIEHAKQQGGDISDVNANGNGNALATICAAYLAPDLLDQPQG